MAIVIDKSFSAEAAVKFIFFFYSVMSCGFNYNICDNYTLEFTK